MTGLIYLYIYDNQISDLSALSGLTGLTELGLDDNQIIDLSALSGLTGLIYLDLDGNEISDLSALSGLTGLTRLDIDNNQISDLRPILNLSNLLYVDLEGNPDLEKIIPPNILKAGWVAVKKHLLASELVPFRMVKVLLLGNSNIGKSDLLEYFETDKKPTLKKSTHGVQYKKLNFNDVEYHFWDFAGQYFYHATHKLFFSPSALNLILYGKDIARDDKPFENIFFPLPYWIRSVELLNRESNQKEEVFLLENKIDLNKNKKTLNNLIEFTEKHPNLNFNESHISLKEQTNLESFKAIFKEQSEALVKRFKYPKIYKTIWDAIKEKSYVTTQDKVLSGYSDIESAFKVLHNFGVLLYFQDVIPNKAFTKPEILLNVLYDSLLKDTHTNKLTYSEIQDKTKNNLLEISAEEIIKLLKHFDLVFEIATEKDTYFIPQYLGPINPYVEFYKKQIYQGVNIRIIGDNYLMNIAMLKIFSIFGTYVGSKKNNYLFWEDGIEIKKDGQMVMVVFDRENQTIELNINKAKDSYQLQKEIVDFILDLPENETTPKRNLDNHIRQETNNNRSLRKHADDNPLEEKEVIELERFKSSYDASYRWHSKYFTVEISDDCEFFVKYEDLVENIELPKIKAKNNQGKDKTIETKTFNNYLKNKNIMKKIFISYSHKDTEYLKDLLDFLSPLERMNKIEKYTDLQLKSGVNHKTEILNNLNDADIVILLISQKFIASNFIQDHELPLAIKKKMDNNGEVVLVSLDQSTIFDLEIEVINSNGNKEIIKMSDFYFIPQDSNNNLKPILYWEDKKAEAWKIVYDDIKSKLK